MRGIIMAGGSGTRLYPLTKVISKQLLPIYDKPLIYYPLSTLMLAGIRDILLISTQTDTPLFEQLLGDGRQFGIHLSYAVQKKPEGIAQAFLIGENFIRNEPCAMILGDNVFYGGWFRNNLRTAKKCAEEGYATIFGHYEKNPMELGVVEFDRDYNVLSIEEKPLQPKSNYGITGLYFYDGGVVERAKQICPSQRGELEITDLNKLYLQENRLKVQILGRGLMWLDAGTIDSMITASKFVETVQNGQGIIISAPEELGYFNKWISRDQLLQAAELYGESSYGKHLRQVADGKLVY